ncbi:hypothetical protein LTR37_019797 [Vermiconidia calcicola]|uniref:Uncharacterized protein n=1 Tax=Vermiconidia calcicola TaxID=1690605 RepID=A0ACC3MDE0_9PEZI|nr:hypothetical protein LTR37_019797 [Vermiconidia calcicola]
MLLKLNPAWKRLQRGLRRVNAEIGRSLQPARSALESRMEDEDTDSLYEPLLREGYIRLLTVLRADGCTLFCKLDTYQQHLAPRYDAITYCWGADTTSMFIDCNGFALNVRKSLAPLLKTCLGRDLPSRPLWIDAICLNQENDHEKAIQVPLMAEIYKRATRTIIWLGEPDQSTEDAVMWIKALPPTIKRVGINKVKKSGLETLGVQCFGEDRWRTEWQGAREYLSRPWFQRLWTVQEVLLSWDVQIMCATETFHMVPWKDFCLLETTMEQVDGTRFVRLAAAMAGHGSGTSRTLTYMETLRTVIKRNSSLPVCTLVDTYQDRACHEPVDRIWGLLGLMRPKLVAKVQEAGIVDYSEQAKREYWRSYIAFQEVLHAFDPEDFFYLIFGDIGRGKTSPLPSWCVDFNAPRRYSSFQTFRKFRAGFTASGDTTAPTSSLDPATCALAVYGFLVDDVSQVTSEYTVGFNLYTMTANQESYKIMSNELLLWLRECYRLQALSRYHSNNVESTKALCSTLFGIDGSNAFANLERVMELYASGDVDNPSEATISSLHQWSSFEDDSNSALEEMTKLMKTCDNRRMYRTRRGYIGLGPPDLQAGDEICAFIGVGPLFALRKAENKVSGADCFTLVGDAYMYGMMFGEALNDPGRAPTRKFDII